MKFLLDEGADRRLLAPLRARGHDVTAVGRDFPAASSDREVLALALAEERVLITHDDDFRQLVLAARLRHRGVILLRLGNATLDVRLFWLDYIVERLARDLDALLVVTHAGITIHRAGRGLRFRRRVIRSSDLR